MANNWNIPKELEEEIRLRDKVCVYCNVDFTSSKGSKELSIWLESKYCKDKNINYNTVAPIIQQFIDNN